MTKQTDYHGWTYPEQGEQDWHKILNPLIEDHIDEEVIKKDTKANRPAAGTKGRWYLATDELALYYDDGTDWLTISPDSEANTDTNGIADIRQHVGPLHQGAYHAVNEEFGTVIGTPTTDTSTTLHSCTVDVNLSSAAVDSVTIELYEVSSRTNTQITTGSLVDSVSTGTLDDGPNRVDLNFTTPDDDGVDEYFLVFDETSRTDGNGDKLEFRRIQSWGGWDDYNEPIDLIQGGPKDTETSDFSSYYYYFFDIEVGDPTTRVQAPHVRRFDVDEIYMRPRDPAEEFDDVSPRALWIDTS